MRYFLDIAYKGTNYHGWQEQENAISVQQTLNESLSRISAEEIRCVGSGRTDTGVHATQQMVHFDSQKAVKTDKFLYQLNAVLPHDISAKSIKAVKPEAHARFDATKRTYHYHIHQIKDPFKEGLSYFFSGKLNIASINSGTTIIKGHKNFESFSKVRTEVNNFQCDIYTAEWRPTQEGWTFIISANRFLRGMVRTIVGTLLDMGQGKLSPTELPLILDQQDRKAAGRSVAAHGLYLAEVCYPEEIYINP